MSGNGNGNKIIGTGGNGMPKVIPAHRTKQIAGDRNLITNREFKNRSNLHASGPCKQ